MVDGFPTGNQLLDFEAAHPGVGSAKENAIRVHLGLHAARYWQLLTRHCKTREALEHDPVTTHRVLAATNRRTITRAERHLS